MSSGGGGGNWGLRALGNETPHRDSAYFSDSDWEADGVNRRSSDGLIVSRPTSNRGGDRGTLSGIEEKTEEEGELREKSPLRNSIKMSDNVVECRETMYIEACVERTQYQNVPEDDLSHVVEDKDISYEGLESAQRDDTGVFPKESKNSSPLYNDPPAKDCGNLIDKLFLELHNEPLRVLTQSGGYPIDNHLIDGRISQIIDCKYQHSSENGINLYSRSSAETNILINSVSGSQSKDCLLSNNDYTSATEMNADLCVLDSLTCGNDTVEFVSPTQVDNRESRLSKLYSIQTTDATVSNGSLSVVKSSEDGRSVSGKINGLTFPPWTEGGEEDSGICDERPALDHNELGLRNLCCPEDIESKGTTETEIQLAAAELSNAMKERSPFRGAARIESVSKEDNDSCEGLDAKTEELRITLEEDEKCTGTGVVGGEFDCHRFSHLRGLCLWPDENDQWASPQRKCQDAELKSEFFSGFSNKTWEMGETLIAGQNFWETNDEHAGSEPHPAVLEACEESQNRETQELPVMLDIKEKWDCQMNVQMLDIQQEENIENPEETGSFKKYPRRQVSDIEEENREIPEKETLERGKISSCMETFREGVGVVDSTKMEENQNFNIWPQNHHCEIQREEHGDKETVSNLENGFSHAAQTESSNISISITEASCGNLSDLEIVESGFNSEAEMGSCLEESVSTINAETDYRDMPPQSNSSSHPSDCHLQKIDQSYPQVDNFSSVDFPSPPPSIEDFDLQDDKLESLDDPFPSPPPSVIETEDLLSHINLEDFIASTETEPCVSPTHNREVSGPPSTTQSIGTSTNRNPPSVNVKFADDSNLTPRIEIEDEHNNLILKSSATPSNQGPLNNLPELLISEWKDLDEEPLEDFEKLEKLCCISEDEEDSLGDLFLGNLELLESLKKSPSQKDSSLGHCDIGEEICDSTPKGIRKDLKEDGISDDSDKMVESAPYVILDPHDEVSTKGERTEDQRYPGHTSDVKEQGSLLKMTTKNGLKMQVCEERLQFSLCENVKTNVLWGSTVKDGVMLRPWGEQITEDSAERVTVKELEKEESPEEQESSPSIHPHTEPDETKAESLSEVERHEATNPQPTANQEMKAKLARLSLALPPLALNIPLTPTGKGGFGDGVIGNRIGRRRGLSFGSDPDDEEEDEQDDESSRRLIVVTETDIDKRIGLRSLLKSPKEPLDRERDRGRNVSFFDDVTIYLFDQETPTNELSTPASTGPAPVSVKSNKLDLRGPKVKSKDSKRKEDSSIKSRSSVGANQVTSSRFTVSPANDPHLV